MKRKIIKNKFTLAFAILAVMAAVLTGCSGSERSSDEVETQQGMDTSGMVHLEGLDEVSALFDEVYGGAAQDLLPANLETSELDLADVDMVSYHTGLEDLSGIEGIYISESMISSVAYSAMYIRTNDEADAQQILDMLMEKVNPAKWICVTAEKEIGAVFGNDVFFVMGAADAADDVFSNASKAAESRGMAVSESVEKVNPL